MEIHDRRRADSVAVSDITDLAVDMLAVVLTSPRPQSFGSQKCQDFLDANPMFAMGLTIALVWDTYHVSHPETVKRIIWRRPRADHGLDTWCAKAIKKPQAKFPYKSMADNTMQIRLDGMGEGFQIKKPSHYSQSVMKTIIENEDSLQLTEFIMNISIREIPKKFSRRVSTCKMRKYQMVIEIVYGDSITTT
ncbi:hypothetical protein CAPTEDRAFT_194698 [Capitella teleta]|uniref:Uncharacterized protein n=1 Tax=Capitella teleta TaxID=283909 RepID=R7VKU7_CAPTE|nr:hypothetical protein CAPTEDRAFT_194698 [Capitella teleta]|eukprot:ELU17671.1 hypothetical protein CAPTEDRAFT_194698 [Capitella teleta]